MISTISRPQKDPNSHTVSPIVTGTSVLGVKYADGVMIACDTLCSYGSLARFKDMSRVHKLGDNTIIGAGGEYSDFQQIQEILESRLQRDLNHEDGFTYSPSEHFHLLRTILYNKRNKFNPLWNDLVVGGRKDGKSFLGSVDKIGTAYEEEFVATGFGSYLAIPIIRDRWHADMDEGEARALLEDCLRVLFYRDCRASNSIQLAKSTDDGTFVSDPYEIETNWEIATYTTNQRTDGSSW